MSAVEGRSGKRPDVRLVSNQGTVVRGNGGVLMSENLNIQGAVIKRGVPRNQQGVYSRRRQDGSATGEQMNGVTREELDAKLKVQDAVAEGRFKIMDERISLAFKTLNDGLAQIQVDSQERKKENKNLKGWMIGTGLSVVIGVASFNATVLSNMVASFDSGRDTAAIIEKSAQDVKNASELLNKVQASLDEQARKAKEMPPPPAPTSQPASK